MKSKADQVRVVEKKAPRTRRSGNLVSSEDSEFSLLWGPRDTESEIKSLEERAGPAEGGQEGTRPSKDQSAKQVKKRKFWQRREDYISEKKKARDSTTVTDAEESTEGEESTVTVGAGDFESERTSTGLAAEHGRDPRVRLLRGDDTARNLPSRKMKRPSRKRVQGWVSKVYAALWTTIAGLANPFFAEVKEIVIGPMHRGFHLSRDLLAAYY